MNFLQKIFHHIFNPKCNWKYVLIILSFSTMGLFLLALYLPLPTAQMPLASEIYDVNQQLVTTYFLQNRRPINLDEAPDFLIKAFLAVEDHRFFEHHGINPGRILKAAWYDIAHRRLAQGASTITQQLAKNAYLSQERSFSRKIKELFYTLKLELHLDKPKILELYLNQIYFGHGAYGIKVAAETYFQKQLDQLNQAEMALLAGLPKGPAYYSPYTHPETARRRLTQTLKRMLDCNYITSQEYQRYSTQKLNLPGIKSKNQPAPYYLDLLQEEVAGIFPKEPGIIYTGGLIIESTLDLTVQLAADHSLQNGLPKLLKDAHNLIQPQGSLIAIDPSNGEIKALIGGTDYSKTQFNRATQAKRQPGSAFKPILYAAALSKGYTLASLVDRTPKTYTIGTTSYRPRDGANDHTSGMLSLRDALASSSNVIAVKLLEELGIDSLLTYAQKMGISSKLPAQLSLALGSGEVTPLELTTAYIPLANGGNHNPPTTIRRILNHDGKVLYQASRQQQQILTPGVAYLVTQALTGVVQEGGTAPNLKNLPNRPIAGKTGTTEANRDAWFVGYTPDLLVCVYTGCDHYEQPLPGAANKVAAPIWADFMSKVTKNNLITDFPIPEDIIKLNICKETGSKATAYCPEHSEYFLKGTEPTDYCQVHRYLKLKICRHSRQLPGPDCQNIIEELFVMGTQPTEICNQCRYKTPIFDWFRRFFRRR